MEKPLRTKRIKISLTEEEHAALLERADGKPLASFMRDFCIDANIPKRRKPPKKVDPELMRKFAGFCNNLNQLTKRTNSMGDRTDTAIELRELRKSVDQLLKDHSHVSDIF